MRRPIVALTAVLALGSAVSCSDSLLGGGNRSARVVLTPQFSERDAEIYSNLRTFDLGATSLQIVLLRPPGDADTVASKSIIVDGTQDSIVVSLDAPINGSEERLIAKLEMRSGSVLLFSGSVAVTASIGATHVANAAPVLVPVWVGPGNNATSIVISPRDLALPTSGKVAFTATAFDATGKPVTDPDFLAHWRWRVNDATLGTIPVTGGEFVAFPGKTGVAMVIVTTPNLLRDTVRVAMGPTGQLARVRFANHVKVLSTGITVTELATATDQNGQPVPNVTLTYTSRTPAIASVDVSTGAITGVSKGQAVIVVRGQASGSQTFFQDSLLAVIAEPAGPVLISSIDRFEYRIDTTITLSVIADMRSSTKLGSTTVDVQWNPSQLLYQSFSNGASGVAPTVNASGATTGKLTFAMADVAGFSDQVELIRITFKTSLTASSGTLTLVAKEITAADPNYTDLLPSLVQVAHSLAIVNPQ